MERAKNHWEQVYATRPKTEVSWFQEHSDVSLGLIRRTGVGRGGAIIDVGGGASRLVDDLLAEGYADLTVLDISAGALGLARRRLGERAEAVTWIEADVTDAVLPEHRFDVWHDRAVFHFLTEADRRERYVRNVRRGEARRPRDRRRVRAGGPAPLQRPARGPLQPRSPS